MENITLRQALSVLDKSSPYSVSTLRLEEEPNKWLKIKDYLYIPSIIETDFKNALLQAQQGDLFFLCGSSGDGKSEILTRLYQQFKNKIKFHLDATHSTKQHNTAVDCLNELFDYYKKTKCPLAIGINVGMMQKYIKYGDETHNDIKEYLTHFFPKLQKTPFTKDKAHFFDFEDYPRLDFSNNQITSTFVSEFIDKLTRESDNNPFWQAYVNDQRKTDSTTSNFKLLSNKTIQKNLIELLGLIRLYNDQFLTPRIFVDFIYKLIVTKNDDGLVGNLFSCLDNDISQKICYFDPNKIRNKDLDSFNLAFHTHSLNDHDEKYINYLCQLSGNGSLSFKGIIQLAYLMKDDVNDHISILKNVFKSEEIEYYLKLIEIYNASDINAESEEILFKILNNVLINSIYKYVNRHLPIKTESYLITRELSHHIIISKADIHYDNNWIKEHKLNQNNFIPIPLTINEEPIIFNLDINLMALCLKIHNGFLPNNQRQENLSKFEEIIYTIIKKLKTVEDIQLFNKNDEHQEKIEKIKSGYLIRKT